eukprot:4396592-Pyramimonas_sp.AAC.1
MIGLPGIDLGHVLPELSVDVSSPHVQRTAGSCRVDAAATTQGVFTPECGLQFAPSGRLRGHHVAL